MLSYSVFGLLSRTQMRSHSSFHHFRRLVIVRRVLRCGWSHLSRKTVRFYCCLNFGVIFCIPGLGGCWDSDFCRGFELCLFSWEEIYCGLFVVVWVHARPLGLVLQRCSIWRRCCPPVYLRCKVTVLQCYLCDRVLCLG